MITKAKHVWNTALRNAIVHKYCILVSYRNILVFILYVCYLFDYRSIPIAFNHLSLENPQWSGANAMLHIVQTAHGHSNYRSLTLLMIQFCSSPTGKSPPTKLWLCIRDESIITCKDSTKQGNVLRDQESIGKEEFWIEYFEKSWKVVFDHRISVAATL